ncbi:MAG: hypothetical protein IJK46_10255 [Prevotella sp.]|nr:hypothetical protein [Prevotella sp.]
MSHLVIHSQPNARLGFSIGKEFCVDQSGGAFLVTYTIKNEGSEARQVAPWEISRVPNTDGLIFFQAVNDSVWPSSLLSFQSAHDAVWYTPDEAPGEAEIQVYVNRGKSYIELESQGAYVTLTPGSQLSWTVRWQLFPVDEESQLPEKLIKKVLERL